MSNNIKIFLLSLLLVGLYTISVEAQRRGGGGRGGMSRGGGSSMSRSSSSSYRGRPSTSRPSTSRPSTSRPSTSRPTTRPSTNRPTTRPSTSRPSTRPSTNPGATNRGSFNRSQPPTRNQLDSFLGGGSAKGARTTNTPSGSGPGWNSKTFETKNGGTITVGGGYGSKTGEGGGSIGAGGKGIQIETAGGKTITKGGLKAGATDGQGNYAKGGAAGMKATDGKGNAVGGARGGVVDSQGNFRTGAVGGAKNQWGYAKVGGRGAQGNLRTGNVNTGVAGAVKGPYGNVVSGGRGAYYRNGQFVGGQSWTKVNGAYTRYGYFGPNYYRRYPGAWWPGKWAVATTAWAATTWAVAGAYSGCSDEGVYYDYGESVTYEDGSVYYEGEEVATEEEYYDEANSIADTEIESKEEEWMPLGVFAIVKSPEQTETERVVQLALNRSGEIKGNLHDLLIEKVTQVSGSVNQKTQRVALKIKGNDELIVETGLYNLTNDEVPILIHYSKDNRQDALLVRLENPETEKQDAKGGE